MSRIDDDCGSDDTAGFLRGCAFEHNGMRAMYGKRGQRFLRELVAALDAMPEKRLVEGRLATTTVEGSQLCGEVCALGAVVVQRKVATGTLRPIALQETALVAQPDDDDDESYDGWEMIKTAAEILGIPRPFAWQVVCANDERTRGTPEERWAFMHRWAKARIRPIAGWFTLPAPAEKDWRL